MDIIVKRISEESKESTKEKLIVREIPQDNPTIEVHHIDFVIVDVQWILEDCDFIKHILQLKHPMDRLQCRTESSHPKRQFHQATSSWMKRLLQMSS